VTGLLAKLLSGQFRLAGSRRDAAREPVDKSNAGHLGHTLTWVRPAPCCASMMLTDLASAGELRPTTLRWAVYHLIEETARHVGHMDITRELLDGSVGR
jgi:Protein of unknown function (DUF664)